MPAPVAEAGRSALARWLMHDAPYIAMLVLALVGVVFRLPVIYWGVLMPVFGVMSIVAGWPHLTTREAHLDLAVRMALSWGALLAAICLLHNTGVQGVFDLNASSLAMMTLLALGTFVASVQAKVWRICAVGAILFVAVPALGWLDQSPFLLAAAAVVFIALGAVAWWVGPHLSKVAAASPT
jgi:hypothetical protein